MLYARIYYSRHSAVHIANFRNPDTRPGIIDVRVGRRCQVYLYFVCSINCKHTHITVYIILFKIRYNYLIPTCVPCGILKFERCGGEGTNFTTPLLQRGIIIEPEILFTAPACAWVWILCVCVWIRSVYLCIGVPTYIYNNNIICDIWQRWRPRVCINIRVFRTMVTQQSKTLCRRPP